MCVRACVCMCVNTILLNISRVHFYFMAFVTYCCVLSCLFVFVGVGGICLYVGGCLLITLTVIQKLPIIRVFHILKKDVK